MQLALINHKELVYQYQAGYRSVETRKKIDANTVFFAGSFSKPLFAFLFLKLTEKGLFSLDEPLVNYLPEPLSHYEKWASLDEDPETKNITARMVLSHSSGMPLLRYLEKDEKLQLVSKPGTRFHYSNEAFNFLGFIVEEKMDRDLDELCREYLFTPLGMKHSGMLWHPEFDQNFAMAHDRNQQTIGAQKRTSTRAAGSLTTTAADYALFVQAILQRKGLPDSLFEEMLRTQISIDSKRMAGPLRYQYADQPSTTNSWGLGWALQQSPYGAGIRHTGHYEGWQSLCVAYPDKGIALIIMCNSDNFEHTAASLLKLIIGDQYTPLEWMGYFDPEE